MESDRIFQVLTAAIMRIDMLSDLNYRLKKDPTNKY
jgi:hypothetical protein